MRYILTGDDKTVQNVLKENRIRIKRGLLSITPLGESDESTDNGNNDGADMDTKNIDNGDDKNVIDYADTKVIVNSDDKTIDEDDEKKPRCRKKKEE